MPLSSYQAERDKVLGHSEVSISRFSRYSLSPPVSTRGEDTELWISA